MSLLLRRHAAAALPLPEAPAEQFAGGFFYWYEVNRRRAERQRRELEEAEEEARRIQDETDREIALLLKKQEAEELAQRETQRLRDLVKRYADEVDAQNMNRATLRAFERAARIQTDAVLRDLMEQLERQFEEEEAAILLILSS